MLTALTVLVVTILFIVGLIALASGVVLAIGALWDGDRLVAAILATGGAAIAFATLNLAALLGSTVTL